MATYSKVESEQYRFAMLFKQFMVNNDINKFSSDELIATAIQINKILNKSKKYGVQSIIKILDKFGIRNVQSKHSKSLRHKLWFHKDLNPTTLKVAVKA